MTSLLKFISKKKFKKNLNAVFDKIKSLNGSLYLNHHIIPIYVPNIQLTNST